MINENLFEDKDDNILFVLDGGCSAHQTNPDTCGKILLQSKASKWRTLTHKSQGPYRMHY